MTLATDRSGELAGVQMMPTTPSENAVSKDLSDASVRRQITDLVSRLHRAGLFSGIVVVSRGDTILVERYGWVREPRPQVTDHRK